MTNNKSVGSLIVPESKLGAVETKREKIEPGVVSAVLVAMYPLGYQQTPFAARTNDKGEFVELQLDGKKVVDQIALTFEIEQEVTEGEFKGNRMLITHFPYFTFSVNEKSNLSKFIKSFTGEQIKVGMDLGKFIGAPANLVLEENDKGYIRIAGASPLKKSEVPLKMQHTDLAVPKFIQKAIDNQVSTQKLQDANPNFRIS